MSILIPGFTRVYVPDMITVHLGQPDESAENVTLPFIDYIKNVASSELYPTWPENALRANIYAIISIALNRVFTEWYRNKGYNFDITSSTRFDQSFVYGRGIYDPINNIVDEIFNSFIVREGQITPLFATFCAIPTIEINGIWNEETENSVMEFQKIANLPVTGSVDEQTWEALYARAVGILNMLPSTVLNFPRFLFPGLIYKKGSEGSGVYILQQYLAFIALIFPEIPAPKITGIFDDETELSVKAFQQDFNLNPDGIVERITWETIARLYESLKSSETDLLNSEPEI